MLDISLDSVEPIVVLPDADQSNVRRILAQEWDRPGQNIDDRDLLIRAPRDSSGAIQQCIIAIDGTPYRGMAVVALKTDQQAVRTSYHGIILSHRDTATLRRFCLEVLRQEDRQW